MLAFNPQVQYIPFSFFTKQNHLHFHYICCYNFPNTTTKFNREKLTFEYLIKFFERESEKDTILEINMVADWGPVVVAVAMFILLSPGLLFQLPARTRVIEFGNMYTSGISILVHAILFFCIYTILIVAIGVHIRSG